MYRLSKNKKNEQIRNRSRNTIFNALMPFSKTKWRDEHNKLYEKTSSASTANKNYLLGSGNEAYLI